MVMRIIFNNSRMAPPVRPSAPVRGTPPCASWSGWAALSTHRLKRMLRRNTLACFILAACALGVQAEIKTLTDITGQQACWICPPSVWLGFYFEDYMAVAGEKGWARVVGISKDAWKGWRPASWKLYTDHMPAIDQLPDMGEVEVMTFSVEKVIALKPDVLVLAEWQVQGLGSDIDQIKSAGIPVLVVDYNAQKLENHLKSTELLGAIAGQPARAAAINKDYQGAIDDINARLAKARLPAQGLCRVRQQGAGRGGHELRQEHGRHDRAGRRHQHLQALRGVVGPYQSGAGAGLFDVVLITGTEGGNLSKTSTAMRIGQGVQRADTRRPCWLCQTPWLGRAASGQEQASARAVPGRVAHPGRLHHGAVHRQGALPHVVCRSDSRAELHQLLQEVPARGAAGHVLPPAWTGSSPCLPSRPVPAVPG